MTEQLCHSAWAMFREMEKIGGVWAALEAGKIQQDVAAVCAERQKAIARRVDILTGTNEFSNIHENKPVVLDIAPAPAPREMRPATMIAPLPRMRLAEPFEALRDASDALLARAGARPKVFLACLGPQVDFTPRVTFAKNFFEAGGIETVSGEGDASALGAAFAGSHAALACLCAADKAYESSAAPASAALKAAGAQHIYLAGRPGTREATLRSAGAQSFIYEGCDALATLRAAYDILGIEQQATE